MNILCFFLCIQLIYLYIYIIVQLQLPPFILISSKILHLSDSIENHIIFAVSFCHYFVLINGYAIDLYTFTSYTKILYYFCLTLIISKSYWFYLYNVSWIWSLFTWPTLATWIQAELTANSYSKYSFDDLLYYVGSVLHTGAKVNQTCYSSLQNPSVTSGNTANKNETSSQLI